MKISFSTTLGLILALALFITSILMSTNNYMLFVSLSSLIVVLGGTLTATLVSYSFPLLAGALKSMFLNLLDENNFEKAAKKQTLRAVELNTIYKKGGVTALENSLTEDEKANKFTMICVELISTGYKGAELEDLLKNYNTNQYLKEEVESEVLSTMSAYAPSFGMVGTLIGLIIMLDNMNGDLGELGRGLSIALLTTLYGTLFAQLSFRPAHIRSLRRAESNYSLRELEAQAFTLILDRKTDMYLEDKLNSYLSYLHIKSATNE